MDAQLHALPVNGEVGGGIATVADDGRLRDWGWCWRGSITEDGAGDGAGRRWWPGRGLRMYRVSVTMGVWCRRMGVTSASLQAGPSCDTAEVCCVQLQSRLRLTSPMAVGGIAVGHRSWRDHWWVQDLRWSPPVRGASPSPALMSAVIRTSHAWSVHEVLDHSVVNDRFRRGPGPSSPSHQATGLVRYCIITGRGVVRPVGVSVRSHADSVGTPSCRHEQHHRRAWSVVAR